MTGTEKHGTEGNSKSSVHKYRKVCFTWNNYSEDWKAQMHNGLEGHRYSIGKEVGESGTKHLQGYIEFKHPVNPIGYKGFPKEIHFEGARGDRECNLKYTQKDGDFCSTFPKPLPKPRLYGWQVFLRMIVAGEPHVRKIMWYHSRDGAVGKSTMAKYLVMDGALICDGKAADIKHQVLQYLQRTGETPKTIVWDIPRSMESYVSYSGMESVKNMCFQSSKYEGGTVVGPPCHLIVFANFMPRLDQDMSRDRFVFVNVDVQKKLWKKP